MLTAVIGGGASGMAAALAAARAGAQVLLFERQARLGRKLAVTGNGRCNLTNLRQEMEYYHGEAAGFPAAALSVWPAEETLAFFRTLGLLTVSEPDGRVYPLSDSAGSVVDVLRFGLEALGVTQRCGCEVSGLRRQGGGFLLSWEGGSQYADRVVVACGGAAGGKVGGVRLGYRLLGSLGHHCTALRPSLVQLRADSAFCKALKGVRADAAVKVLRRGQVCGQSEGEVQFTEYGLSGPAVFAISRAALAEPDTLVSLDLLRGLTMDSLSALLCQNAAARPGLTMDELFTGSVQNRLGRTLVKAAGYSAQAPLETLTQADADKLAHTAKHFDFPITGDLGFDNAQVTAGGVRTEEFDPGTLESLLCPGLYACGEVLDVDGDCGGYNLQWAWSSGLLAGASAAKG